MIESEIRQRIGVSEEEIEELTSARLPQLEDRYDRSDVLQVSPDYDLDDVLAGLSTASCG